MCCAKHKISETLCQKVWHKARSGKGRSSQLIMLEWDFDPALSFAKLRGEQAHKGLF
jgi:hypothetical protein